MKHLILSTLLLVLCCIGYAQVNLREGIVITLVGDTLHGDIDYRTDAMNAEHCSFIQDGQSEVRTYHPGEIYGYRFIDNGRFYVSKEVTNEHGMSEMLFLEFVVRGKLNLYYKGNSAIGNVLYIEDETGELITVDEQTTVGQPEVRRRKLSKLLYAFKDSKRAQKLLWERDLTRINATKAVITHNDETCPDGVCEVYQYKKKRTPRDERPIQWAIKAGYTYYGLKIDKSMYSFDYDYFSAAQVSAGMDIYVRRLCPGLLAEVFMTYAHISGTTYHDIEESMPGDDALEANFNHIDIRFGPAYQWVQWRVQPRVRVGATVTTLIGSYGLKNWRKKTSINKGINLANKCGVYFGGGLVIPQGRHAWTLDADYFRHRYNGNIIRRLDVSLGYQF